MGIRYKTIFILLLLGLTGCQLFPNKMSQYYPEGISRNTNMAVLPFIDFSDVPDEDSVQLERILFVQLASKGVNTAIFKKQENNTSLHYFADIYQLEQAQLWAKRQNIKLLISGEIIDWHYDENNVFSTTLKLKILDTINGEEIWSIKRTNKGLPGEDAYDVSRSLISDFVTSLPFQ